MAELGDLKYKMTLYDEIIRSDKYYRSLCDDGKYPSTFEFVLISMIELISSESERTEIGMPTYIHELSRYLDRLSNNLPLTPIDENDFEFSNEKYIHENPDIKATYQCERYTPLFKDVHNDGTITYTDVGRVRFFTEGIKHGWTNQYLTRVVIDKMYPIELPYYPSEYNSFDVFIEEYLHDGALKDYDICEVLYAINKGTKEKIQINRYFREKIVGWYCYEDKNSKYPKTEWEEISKEEYVNLLESPQIYSAYKEGDPFEDRSKSVLNDSVMQTNY